MSEANTALEVDRNTSYASTAETVAPSYRWRHHSAPLRPRKLQVYMMYCILLRPTAREASDGGRAQAPFKPTPFGSDFTRTKLSQDRQGGAWTSGAKTKQTDFQRNPCHFQPLDLHRDKWGDRFFFSKKASSVSCACIRQVQKGANPVSEVR
jgi:hypothetical protein